MTATLSLPIRFEFDNPQEIRHELLRLIKEDECVKEEIKKAIGLKGNTEVAFKSSTEGNNNFIIEELNDKLSQRDKELNKLKEKILTLQKNEENCEPFKDILQMYRAYKNLSEDVKNQFSNVFLHNNLLSFVSCISQQDSPMEIWDSIKRCMDGYEIESSKIEFMKSMLIFSVKMSNGSRSATRQMELFEPQIGESFSDRWHCVYDAGGNKQGRIEEVILVGIRYHGESKMLRPSLVLLR